MDKATEECLVTYPRLANDLSTETIDIVGQSSTISYRNKAYRSAVPSTDGAAAEELVEEWTDHREASRWTRSRQQRYLLPSKVSRLAFRFSDSSYSAVPPLCSSGESVREARNNPQKCVSVFSLVLVFFFVLSFMKISNDVYLSRWSSQWREVLRSENDPIAWKRIVLQRESEEGNKSFLDENSSHRSDFSIPSGVILHFASTLDD